MDPDPTAAGRFPSTAWSMISGLQGSDATRARSLEALARCYWKPIYSYLRRALRCERQDAEDLTQAFLTWLLEAAVLSRYDAGEGAFRPYLKALLRNFLLNQRRSQRAQKRGGGSRRVPLEVLGADAIADREQDSPEAAFDRAWVEELIARATERMRLQLHQEGKRQAFEIFAAYDMPPAGELPTYDSVAAAAGVSPNSVRHQLYKVRERLRGEIRAELRDTVQDPQQLEQEWRALFL